MWLLQSILLKMLIGNPYQQGIWLEFVNNKDQFSIFAIFFTPSVLKIHTLKKATRWNYMYNKKERTNMCQPWKETGLKACFERKGNIFNIETQRICLTDLSHLYLCHTCTFNFRSLKNGDKRKDPSIVEKWRVSRESRFSYFILRVVKALT